MADTSELQAQVTTNQRAAGAARAEAARLRSQAASVQQQIAKVEKELAELRSFKRKAERDTGELFGQLQDRQRVLQQLGELDDVRMARQLFEMVSSQQAVEVRRMLADGADDVTSEVDQGIARAERELERLRQQLASLQSQAAQQDAVAAQCDRNAQAANDAIQAARAAEAQEG